MSLRFGAAAPFRTARQVCRYQALPKALPGFGLRRANRN